MTDPGFQIQFLNTRKGSGSSLYALAEDHSGMGFYSAGGSGEVVYWPDAKLEEGILVSQGSSPVMCLYNDDINNELLIGTLDGFLFFVDTDRKALIKRMKLIHGGLFAILSDEAGYYVTGDDGTITQIDRTQRNVVRGIQISGSRCRALAFDSDFILAGTTEGSVYKIDSLRFNQPVKSRDTHLGSVFGIISYQQHYISCGKDGRLIKWDQDLKKADEVQAHNTTINSITLIGDTGMIASACRDGSIRIWDCESLELLKVIDLYLHSGHLRSVNKLIWNDHHNVLISCSDDRNIKMWEIY